MKKLLVLILLLTVSTTIWAQLDTKHYIPPMYARQDPATGNNEDIYLVLSSPQTTPFDVTITDGAGNLLYTGVTLSRATPVTLALSNAAGGSKGNGTKFLVPASDLATVIQDEGIILSANKAFFVNLRVDEGAQAAALTTKGAAALGTEFRTGHVWNNTTNNSNVFNRKAHIISFIASEDGTDVTVSDFGNVDFENINEAAQPVVGEITVSLDEGESYVLAAHVNVNTANINDVNGTRINSTKPITVNTGSWLGGNPIDGNLQGRDIGIDQIASLEETGFEYILVKGQGNGNENVIVVASIDGTQIFLNGSTVPSATLNGGEYFRFIATDFTAADNMHISANQPVYVYQNTNGSNSSNERQNGLNFIPPIVCLGGTDVDIADADFTRAFGGTINGTVLIIGEKNANVTITEEDGTVNTLTDLDASDVTGNSKYVTYKESGYSGNITVSSPRPIRVALTIESGNVGAAGFFSGFTTAPVIESPNGYDAATCIPENVPVELVATGFDSYQWFRNGVRLNGETNASLFVEAPGEYTARGTISGCVSSEQSFELEIALCPADVGIAKDEVSVENISGSIFDITYDLYLENFSIVNDADNVQVIEDISAGLPSGASVSLQSTPQVIAGSFSQGGINPAFDGSSVTQMLQTSTETKIDPSEVVTIRFTVRVDMSGAVSPTYTNQSIVSTKNVGPNDGSNPDQQDFSTDGTDPDPDGNGDPTGTEENETTQTCLSNTSIAYNSSIFYTSGANPIPNIIGFSGGEFTASNSGITIDNATGEIDLATTIVGSYTVTYAFGGLCGVTTNVTIELNPPAEPTIFEQTTNTSTPTISGSAILEAGETLFVTVGGQTYELGVDPELTIDGTTWSLDVPSGVITADGTYEVEAVIDNGMGGTTSDTSSSELIIDTNPPSVDIQGVPTVVNSTDPYTVTFEFSEGITGFDITDIDVGNGTAANLIKIDENTYTVQITPNGNGDITIDLPNGSVQDEAGNDGTAASQGVTTYDDVPPATPTTSSIEVNDNTPIISGSTGTGAPLNPGEMMTVEVNGATYMVVPDADGNWTLDLETATPSSGTLGVLVDGVYQVVTTVTDAAGNVASDISTDELVIDTESPAVPVLNVQTTNDTSPIISGSSGTGSALAAGESMTVEVNGAIYSVIPDADGNWSLDLETATPISGTLGAFVDGISYEVEVIVEDAAGNSTTDSSSNEITIDTSAPATPSVNNVTACVGTDPVIEGTSGTSASLNAGEIMEVEVNGATYTVDPDVSGNWSIATGSATPSAGTLGSFDGGVDYQVVVKVVDGAGNESDVTGLVTIVSIPTVNLISSSNPTTCNGTDGEISLSFTNVPDGSYDLGYLDVISNPQTISNVSVTGGTATLQVGQGTYNDITLSVSGCTSNGNVDVVLVDPLVPTISIVASTNPTTCGGDGSIDLNFTNVPDGSYTIDYASGSFPNVSISAGAATIVAGAGNYADFSIVVNGCTSIEDPDATLLEPTPPTISFVSSSDPTTCNGTDGVIEISGLAISTSYSVSYAVEGAAVNTNLTSDGSGNLTIGGLGEGDITNIFVSGSGCTSNTLVGAFTLSDPVTASLAILSSNDPSSCAGSDGQIVLSGLENSLTYSLNYMAEGSVVSVASIISEADGTLVISGLPNGNYSDFQVTKNGCSSNVDAGPVVLTDPTPPTISSTVGTDPTTCATTDGEIDLNGLNDLDAYDIEYSKDGAITTLSGVNSSGGTYIINGLSAGTYTNISVTVVASGCQSNIISSLILNPPDISLGTTADPTSCNGTDGTIQIVGLAANTTYDLNYELDGVAAATSSVVSDATGEYTVTGLTAGSYTLLNVTNSGCVSNDLSIILSDPTPPVISLGTLSDPTTCQGDDGSIQLLGLEASTLYKVQYFISSLFTEDILTDGAGNLTIPDLSAEDYIGITVSINGCSSNVLSATLSSPAAPTVILGTNPEVCMGETNVAFSYSGETNSPNRYRVDFDATAEGQGFVDINTASLGTSPINIPVPAGASPAIYNGVFTVINSSTGCFSEYPISITVNALPSIPTINQLNTNNIAPVIAGNADPGNAVTVIIAGATFNTVANASGDWSVDTNAPDAGVFAPNQNGVNEVLVTASDGTCSIEDASNGELTIDTTAPQIPTVLNQTTMDSSPILRGTAEPGSILTVEVGGATFQVNVDSNGNWVLDTETEVPVSGIFNPNVNGGNEVILTSADAAGNTSTDTSSLELVIDTTPPTAPTIDNISTVDSTPEISGTAEPGSLLEITVGGATYLVVADASGNWSIDTGSDSPSSGVFAPNLNGANEVVVVSTDAAGNTSTDTSTLELIIYSGDEDGDGIPDAEEDLDGDGDPTNDDSDGDGIPDFRDNDDDGDGILTEDEDRDNDSDFTNDDCDEDGVPDYRDSDPCDTDGDGILDDDEDTDNDDDPYNDDCDSDGTPNFQDADPCDSDGDGLLDGEDTNGDGDPYDDDCDGDGIPNFQDSDPCDTDGDGITDNDEDTDGDGNPSNDDCDMDGVPNFKDTDPCDSDGDGLLDGEDSDQDGNPYNDDCDGDGIPNFQDADPCDTDGDGINDGDEDTDGDGDPTNDDCDNDGVSNYQDPDVCDTDGDGINDEDEDTDGDGDLENDDCDGDGTPNYQDTDSCDTDGDGINDEDEDTDGDGNPYNDDCDGDGTPNFQDTDPCDSDGDGLLDGEDSDQDGNPYNDDCDGDGIPNFQDADPCDTDGDGINDGDEDTDGDGDPTNDDCDNDGVSNYQDPDVCDTDGDGINDEDEDTDGDGDLENDDCDGDGTPNYQDTDSCDTDGDGINDEDEDTDGDGNPYNDDCDGDGTPNFQDTDPCDSDGDGLLDGEDSDQDGNPYNDDCDGDGIPNFQDADPCDTDGDGINDGDEDTDGDGDPTNDDCDNDGVSNYQDPDVCDTDGDGINDEDEDTDGDGDLENDDCDGDGTPNYQDTDSCDTDGDGINDEDEDTDGDGNPYNDDCDGDGTPNFQDTDPCDSDGDGLLDGEDSDQDGNPYNDDCDGDGIPNFQDADPCDTDGDGINDGDEDTDGDGDPTNDDCDNDGVSNYQDPDVCDTDGDGINDEDEDTDGDGDLENDDCDGDGTPNYQDTDSCDTDGDGLLDGEDTDGDGNPYNDDCDGDGIPNFQDADACDTDGDGINDDDEDTDGDGNPYNDDCDSDGTPNFQDADACDTDGDGINDDDEDTDGDGNPYNDDCDGDGIPNFQDADACDTDGDGINDDDEDTDGDGNPYNDDCDEDGIPNFQDADACDTDDDGINDDDEDTDGDGNPYNDDCDEDGTPNFLDADACDTDGDGINDDDEDTDGDGNPYNDDCDEDGIPNFQDADACDTDGDGINDGDEDTDGDGNPYNDDCDEDGTPNFLDADACDTDGDGINDDDEDTDGDGNPYNDDCDEDGIPNFQDADACDTDGDGINDDDEDTDGDGNPYNDDCDGDGIPNFQDADACDTDGDGINDDDEDTDGDGNPYNDDCDEDGIPNFQDADACDTDGDGINDDDEDTDGDGNPYNDDCDGDGIPNFQDADSCDTDGDGINDDDEDTDGDGNPYNDDCDGDGIPNFQDADACDTDGDGINDDDEDTDGDGNPYNDDCDGDGIPNFQDVDACDTDGDGINDDDEDTDGDGDPTNDDCDADGIPNYLDTDPCDTDGDGVLDDDEDTDGDGNPYNDDCDGDGIPNFQDADACDTDGDGINDDDEDTDGDGNPYNDDCDGDGIPNFQDADTCDTDGDGINDDDEDTDGDGNPYNDDCDGDGVPNFQDEDLCSGERVTPQRGFTPDGDGQNDFFYIEGIEDYPGNNVKIFNRWGNRLFEISGYNNQDKVWRGEANFGIVPGRNDVPAGTYFYLIDLGDNQEPLSGFIVIRR